MRRGQMIVGLAIILVLAAGGTAYAGASGGTSGGTWWHPPVGEVPLEGDVLANTVAAAVAQVGADATVLRAETDANGNAAYEVHMKLADGTLVTVYVDEAFAVVRVDQLTHSPKTDSDTDDEDDGTDEPSTEPRVKETPLEGDVLAQVVAVATAQVGAGATVVRAETDADGNALYEVHMLTADGKKVTVYVDASYAVVKVAEKGVGSHFGKMSEYPGHSRKGESDAEQHTERDQTQTQTQTQSKNEDAQHDRDGSSSRSGGDTSGGSDGGSHKGGGSGQ